MATVVTTTTIAERMPGTVTLRKRCQAFAPSSSAASFCSGGTALIAAERMTIARPVWLQMNTTMSKRLFTSGVTASHDTGSPPKSVTIAFRMPSWSPCR